MKHRVFLLILSGVAVWGCGGTDGATAVGGTGGQGHRLIGPIPRLPPSCPHVAGAVPVAMDGGGYTTCVLLSDGTTWCWGIFAHPDTIFVTPVRERAPCFESIGVDSGHVCGRTNAGDVFCWGANERGLLGLGDRDDRAFPTRVPLSEPAKALESGVGKSCVLTEAGTPYCWGQQYGKLLEDWLSPTKIDATATAVAVGENVCLIRPDSTLWCMGFNSDGQLGDGSTDISWVPVQAKGLTDVAQASVFLYHMCAVLADGTLACWGNNDEGQLGTGDTTNRLVPTIVDGLPPVARTGVGGSQSCAITTTGELYCWGIYTGDGTYNYRFTPVKVVGLDNEVVVDVKPGLWHTCALTAEGNVYCWGEGDQGQLGVGDPPPAAVAVPTKVHCSWCDP